MEASRDEMVLRIPRVGRFVVRRGEPVAVERAAEATDADVRCFLTGPVAAAEALLRGAIPLHASAVVIGGRAVVVAGLSGVGKSGVAAALAMRGHAVLADAVTVLEPFVRPHAPRPVLWPDLVEQLGLAPDAGELVRPALPKRSFQLGPASDGAPLGTVVFLGRDALCEQPTFSRLVGTKKTGALLSSAWYRRLTEPLGLAQARFGPLAEVAARTECVEVVRPRDNSSVVALATVIEEAAG